MTEEHGRKDSTSFEPAALFTGQVEGKAISVTDDDIDLALSKLQALVEGEKVPSAWGNKDASAPTPAASVTSVEAKGTARDQEPLHAQPHRVTREAAKRKQVRSNRWRKTGIGAAVALVLVGVLVSPLGGKAMAAAMQTLYFHNLVGLPQSDLSQIQQALQTSGVQRIDLKQYGSVQVSGNPSGSQQSVSLTQASQMLGYSVKALPGYNPKRDMLSYTPGSTVTFRLNVTAINNLIRHMGGKTEFPASVNGEPIVVQIPAQVYENVLQSQNQDMSLSQQKMPTVEVPGNVDMGQIKQALLDLPFLPGDIRQSLLKSSNWQNTLYVPVGGTVTNFKLNGNPAVLQTWPSGQQRSLMWLTNGVLYRLNGSPKAFPTDASIITEAKELSK